MFLADYFDDGYFDVEYWGSFLLAPSWSTDAGASDGWTDEAAVSATWTADAPVATIWSTD